MDDENMAEDAGPGQFVGHARALRKRNIPSARRKQLFGLADRVVTEITGNTEPHEVGLVLRMMELLLDRC